MSRDAVKAMLALDWHIEYSEGGGQAPPSSQDTNPHNYRPQPADMTTLSQQRHDEPFRAAVRGRT